MLLLMMHPQDNAVVHLGPLRRIQGVNELHHAVINRRTVGVDILHRRTRQIAPFGTLPAFTNVLIVRVKRDSYTADDRACSQAYRAAI